MPVNLLASMTAFIHFVISHSAGIIPWPQWQPLCYTAKVLSWGTTTFTVDSKQVLTQAPWSCGHEHGFGVRQNGHFLTPCVLGASHNPSDPLFLSVQNGASAVWLEAVTPGAGEGAKSEGERKAHQAPGGPSVGSPPGWGMCGFTKPHFSAHSSSLLLPPMEFGP